MFELILVEKGKESTLYTVKFDDSDITEFDKFLSDIEIQNSAGFKSILKKIELIKDKYGSQEHFFEYDGSFSDDVCKLKRKKLRLYCCRYSNIILILGGGGIKEKHIKRTQDDPILLGKMTKMKIVSDKIQEYIDNMELKISNNEFQKELGDLYFQTATSHI